MRCETDGDSGACRCGCSRCVEASDAVTDDAPVAVWWTEWQARPICSHAPTQGPRRDVRG